MFPHMLRRHLALTHSRSKWMGGWRCPQTTRRVKPKYFPRNTCMRKRGNINRGVGGHYRITCMLGRGRGRVPAHDLRSSSRARLSISNCLSCSRTEASREAVLAHCSIHTLRVEQRTGQGRINTREHRTFYQGDRQPQRTDQEPGTRSEAVNVRRKPTQVQPA